MKIAYYNRVKTKLFLDDEAITIYPNLFIADTLFLDSVAAHAMLNYLNVDNFSYELIIDGYEEVHKDDPKFAGNIANARRYLPTHRKYLQMKHKSKEVVRWLNQSTNFFRIASNHVKIFHQNYLEHYSCFTLLPFVEDDIIDVDPSDFNTLDSMDHVFLQRISDSIIGQSDTLSLDMKIEELFSYVPLMSNTHEFADIMTFPLVDFPKMSQLNYAQIKYTRDNFKPALAPFKNDFKSLANELINIPFTADNSIKIKQLCEDKLAHHKEILQKSLDESLYIVKLNHEFPLEAKQEFHIGVASINTVVDFYEKTEIVQPYMASEIKYQIARKLDLNSSYLFSYCKSTEPYNGPDPAHPLPEL
ncbi:MAG: hypothetical protein WCH34_15995 [Bacteroidota bacterium]